MRVYDRSWKSTRKYHLNTVTTFGRMSKRAPKFFGAMDAGLSTSDRRGNSSDCEGSKDDVVRNEHRHRRPVDMRDVTVLPEPAKKRARDFFALLRDRAVKGIGGEIRVEWPEGPAWIKSHLPVRYDLGGTGPHAARALSALGAKALVALQDRSAQMLSLFPPDVVLAEATTGSLPPNMPHVTANQVQETFIFEYAASIRNSWGRSAPILADHRALRRPRCR